MFNRVKSVLYNVVGGLEALPVIKDAEPLDKQPLKFPYTRPHFLQLTTEDEVQVSADHSIRPIIVPRDMTKLPWNSGYAEAINAGKSVRNEDQAAVYRGLLCRSFTDGQVNIGKESNSYEIPIVTQIGDNAEIKTVPENLNSEEIDSVAVPSTSDSINTLSLNESHFRTPPSTPEPRKKLAIEQSLPWIYFGLFDGHAGSGVAVAAAKTLHTILQVIHSFVSIC
ncbi:protein phosphatase 1H-like [Centruroides sculpturatus]|uniref:protein phosphatase 1H-like n=1 Tax=Centruroides sculpturatus TaxID=218467 RepID=UPI000C6ECB3E|nr:protein phosphatase 1H-like [Centruroides sculpturatus]